MPYYSDRFDIVLCTISTLIVHCTISYTSSVTHIHYVSNAIFIAVKLFKCKIYDNTRQLLIVK